MNGAHCASLRSLPFIHRGGRCGHRERADMLRCAVWSAGRALNVQHVFLVGGLLTAGALVPAIAAGGGMTAGDQLIITAAILLGACVFLGMVQGAIS